MEWDRDSLGLERDLKRGLRNEEFVLYYQPRMNIRTGKVTGAEALVRWNHPDHGMIYPDNFIPCAEQTGLVLSLGEQVLRQACLQQKAWENQGVGSLVVSVNFSPRQIYENNIVERVSAILKETGVKPEHLEIEITENVMMDVDYVVGILNDLKRLGIGISLDDFGTGYSSLSYLKNLPLDKLKIDQSFVFTSTTDMNDQSLVKTIIAMGHQLKLGVVAEGVETRDHLVLLQRNVCEEAQGYFFSKPIPPALFYEKMPEWEHMVRDQGVGEWENSVWQQQEAKAVAREELLETLQKQQGFTFKYHRENRSFIHTMADGELLYRLGYLPEKVVGSSLYELLPEPEAALKESYYERAWNGEQGVVYEGLLNGVSYIASLSPIVKGKQVVEVIGSCIEITQQKKAEERLVQKERGYQHILDRLTEKIILLEDVGTITYMSASLRDLLDYKRSELSEIPLREITCESDRLFMSENLKKLRTEDVDTISGYVTLMMKNEELKGFSFRMMRVAEEKEMSIAVVVKPVNHG
ncbi:sensor domain-containing phosphodiesterase [Salimicrobium halophilum]|uniref:PAS domain S-box-containing protein n=1 Tax=Salimicrobium halophilum TaxID=86666 RepID=A0A1G8WLI2_9BACI|nr:EAL domain-containing protein [Salimicrobium halophilum]SDJ79222.1 PAS domain S-box-containing protein [Salimicrobium halophilum]